MGVARTSFPRKCTLKPLQKNTIDAPYCLSMKGNVMVLQRNKAFIFRFLFSLSAKILVKRFICGWNHIKKFYECDEVHACSHCFFVVLLSYLAARKNMHITLFDMAANCRNLGEFLKDPAFSICESAKWIFLPFQEDFLGVRD